MSSTLSNPSLRTPAKSFRSDSQPVRTVSHQVRIDAKSEFLAVINEVRTTLGISIETMAINAGCPTSSMSDALAGKDGRNFAGPWLIAQGNDFIRAFNEAIDRRRGLSDESVDEIEAEEIGQLVTSIVRRSFRVRKAVNQ